jgi:adenylylsulfate kinase
MNKAQTIWFTGLPSAGKTTLAQQLHQKLCERSIASVIIDGDDFRKSFCSDLDFSLESRRENIRRAASMARLVINSGVVAICSFVSPTRSIRQLAKTIVGDESFVEVYVSTPLEICKQRDVKGLYHHHTRSLSFQIYRSIRRLRARARPLISYLMPYLKSFVSFVAHFI